MLFQRTARARWPLLLCGLLLSAVACKDYRRDTLELDGYSYRVASADMVSTDTFSLIYPIGPEGVGDGQEVTFQNSEPSITADAGRVDSLDGLPYLRINYRTRATPSGSYPVKAVLRDKNGAFAEVVTVIAITNYAELLRRDTVFNSVTDSVAFYPFTDPGDAFSFSGYGTRVRAIPGAAPGTVRFTDLGFFPGLGTIENVRVVLDSLTGTLTAPLQQTGGVTGYSGAGRLERLPGASRIRGYFVYDYYSFSGTHYAGRLSFF